jgi:RNA polymerase sigma factor (sigma-70 family)
MWPHRIRLPSDEQLVAAVRAGRTEAFEALYDRFHAQILAFCTHVLGSPEEGEDATQHVFVDAYRALRASRARIDLRPWLYAIARNRCRSMLRGRREGYALEQVGGEPIASAAAEPAAAVVAREDLRELLADVRALPEAQREALLLFELGDLSHAQIAVVLDRRPAQVKALVYQARTTLMHERESRTADCEAVRVEIAAQRDAARLSGRARRHVRRCEVCRGFAAQVRSQRSALALVLPVVPAAGLKAATLHAALGSGAAAGGSLAGGTAAGGAGAGLGKGLAAKIVATAALAGTGGAAVAGVAAVDHHHHRSRPAALRPVGARRRGPAAPAAAVPTIAERPPAAVSARTPAAGPQAVLAASRPHAPRREAASTALSTASASPAPLAASTPGSAPAPVSTGPATPAHPLTPHRTPPGHAREHKTAGAGAGSGSHGQALGHGHSGSTAPTTTSTVPAASSTPPSAGPPGQEKVKTHGSGAAKQNGGSG